MVSLITCSTLGSSSFTHPGGLARKQARRCNSTTATQVHLPLAAARAPWLPAPISSSRPRIRGAINPVVVRASAAYGAGSNGAAVPASEPILTRKSFPTGFVFGAATSSYQIEGAWNEDGKGPSVWDHYCHTFPERILDMSNGDDAVNSYHMFEEDVKMLKAMGMDAYRFSISWPRILPTGKLKDGVNEEGIKYYNKLINKLIENGIKPYVTLFHWETPQALDEAYGSFLDRRIVNDFKVYADVCFKNFGDRVKHWFTFNEPYVFCTNAYSIGKHAPGRCSPPAQTAAGEEHDPELEGGCAVEKGDSLVEPYLAGHHLILAHAEAFHLYRNKYQQLHEGEIGLALVSQGYEPYDTRDHVHAQAQDRSIDFNLGWFMEPVFRGDYPFAMRALVKDRLPFFTSDEQKRITGTYDMLGLNYYTSRFSQSIPITPNVKLVHNPDDAHSLAGTIDADGKPIGPNTGTNWLYSYPEGLKNLLMVMKDRYRNPPIYITENGVGDIDDGNLSMEEAMDDTVRLQYLKDHLAKLKEAGELGANVRGHFTWSLMDNFEWQNGYTQRFGVIYVDRKDNYKRHMKKSARWFAEFNGVAGGRNIRRPEFTAAPVKNNGFVVPSNGVHAATTMANGSLPAVIKAA